MANEQPNLNITLKNNDIYNYNYIYITITLHLIFYNYFH